jgi:hypothetical protein
MPASDDGFRGVISKRLRCQLIDDRVGLRAVLKAMTFKPLLPVL